MVLKITFRRAFGEGAVIGHDTPGDTGDLIYNLLDELAQGHRVIVGVDSGELTGQTGFLHDLGEFFGQKTPDHALVVSAVDAADPENLKVIVTDPGTGEVAHTYTREEFENAWGDSNCFYVTTNNPPSGLSHFDYDRGHYDNFLPMDYTEFHDSYKPYMDIPLDFSGVEGPMNIYSLPDHLPEFEPMEELANDSLDNTDEVAAEDDLIAWNNGLSDDYDDDFDDDSIDDVGLI